MVITCITLKTDKKTGLSHILHWKQTKRRAYHMYYTENRPKERLITCITLKTDKKIGLSHVLHRKQTKRKAYHMYYTENRQKDRLITCITPKTDQKKGLSHVLHWKQTKRQAYHMYYTENRPKDENCHVCPIAQSVEVERYNIIISSCHFTSEQSSSLIIFQLPHSDFGTNLTILFFCGFMGITNLPITIRCSWTQSSHQLTINTASDPQTLWQASTSGNHLTVECVWPQTWQLPW